MFNIILATLIVTASIIIATIMFPDKTKRDGTIINRARYRRLIKVVGLVLAFAIIGIACFTYVPTGYTGIVTTFGKVHDATLDAGISFKAPWDNVIKMDNREQRSTFQLEAFSKDIQQVDIQGSINYNIDKATAMNLYKDVGTQYVSILVGPRIQEDVKIIVAQYNAENLIAGRQAAANDIETLIREELTPKGINIISLAIENIDFTDAFESAVEAKQVATQEKLKAQTQQEQATMEAEQAAKRKTIAAQADAEVAQIQADAEAYAVSVRAEAEAEANKKISASLTKDLIDYTQVNAWDGKLPVYNGGNGTIPIINFGETNTNEQ